MNHLWCRTALLYGMLFGASAAFSQGGVSPATQVGDGYINLDLNGVDAEEAFDQLGKQAGVEFSISLPGYGSHLNGALPVTLKVQHGRFWPVVIEMCKQSHIALAANGDGSRVYLSSDAIDFKMKSITQVQGFVLIPSYAQSYVSRNLVQSGDTQSSLHFDLNICSDPKDMPQWYGSVSDIQAEDEKGMSLMSKTCPPLITLWGKTADMAKKATILMKLPPNRGRTIARLKGVLHAVRIVKSQTIEIDLPLTNQPITQELPDLDISITSLKLEPRNSHQDNIRYELRSIFTFLLPAGRISPSLRPWSREDFC